MKWNDRPATIEDCQAVLGDLSGITARGLERAKISPEQALDMCRDLLRVGQAIACEVNGKVVGIFGWGESDFIKPPIIDTWSLWTPFAFDGKTGAFTALSARNFLRKLAADHPGSIFMAISHSDHPDLDRWFRILGFEKVKDYEDSKLYSFLASA